MNALKDRIRRARRWIFAALWIVAAAVMFTPATAEARTVNWGDDFGGVDLQSDGVGLDGTFTFEIGTFGATFTPDENNTGLWAANWKTLDTGTYNAGVGFVSSTFQLDPHPTLMNTLVSDQNGTDVFAEGEQAYIWVYNTTAIVPTTEWALFTDDDGVTVDNWVIPDAGDQTGTPLNWRQSTATAPVFGGLNDVTGPGLRSDTSTVFDYQTHRIPEPSSALLVTGALFLFAGRRRRARASKGKRSL